MAPSRPRPRHPTPPTAARCMSGSTIEWFTATNSTEGANQNFPFLAVFDHHQRIPCISFNSSSIDKVLIWICSTNSCAITDRERSTEFFLPEYWYLGVL